MIRIGILSIINLGFTVNLFAESSAIILQQKDQHTNLFIAGEAADSLYELLIKGVPIESLPNGSYVEGGNIACAKTANNNNDIHSYCALSIGQEGLTKDETPTFVPAVTSLTGVLELKGQKSTGEIQMHISGDVGLKLFSLLNVSENKQGIKVGKNILCQKINESTSCSTLINQRGFADFPEALLAINVRANLTQKFRGQK
jgi:hypothetical protein